MTDAPAPSWLKKWEKRGFHPLSNSEKKAVADQHADDTDMLLLQSCHDSITSVTLDIHRLAPQVVAVAQTECTTKIATESLALLKKIVVPGAKVEQLLMQPKDTIMKHEAEDAVMACGKIFEEMRDVHSQMLSILKRAKSKGKSSGKGDKMK